MINYMKKVIKNPLNIEEIKEEVEQLDEDKEMELESKV